MNKTYLRQSHECRANHWRTFHDIRETHARSSPDEIASIYYHRAPHDVLTNVVPPHDVLANVVRLSCDCRANVVRLSHDGFARNDKPRKMNILASTETSDQEGTTLLEGTRGLEGA